MSGDRPINRPLLLYRVFIYFAVVVLVFGLVFGYELSSGARWLIWLLAWLASIWLFSAGFTGLRRMSHVAPLSVDSAAETAQPIGSAVKAAGIFDSMDQGRFVALVAPKWGEDAASLLWKRNQIRVLVAITMSLLLITVMLADLRKPLTWGVISVLALAGLSLLAVSLRMGRRMYEHASIAIGVEVGWMPGQHPPNSSRAYRKWCLKNGVDPYEALQFNTPGRSDHSSSSES